MGLSNLGTGSRPARLTRRGPHRAPPGIHEELHEGHLERHRHRPVRRHRRRGGEPLLPRRPVDQDLLRPSDTHTVCPWKGTASYWTLEVDGATNADAAWYYPQPKDAAAQIRDRVAFWKGVTVEP